MKAKAVNEQYKVYVWGERKPVIFDDILLALDYAKAVKSNGGTAEVWGIARHEDRVEAGPIWPMPVKWKIITWRKGKDG